MKSTVMIVGRDALPEDIISLLHPITACEQVKRASRSDE